MQNPNNNPNSFNNMNLELDPRDPSPQRTIEKVVDLTSQTHTQSFPGGQPPFYPQGNFQQTPWNQPNPGQTHQGPNTGPYGLPPSMSNIFHNQINQKEIQKAKLNSLESQIRSLIISYTVGTTATIFPPQILSLNGYRVEGASEKLKHFDKDAKVEIINSLMNFYSFTKSNIDNLSNIRDALNGIVKDFDSTIEHQTNMLEALSTEIEIIKKEDSAESSEMVKKEALASFEELAASLRNLGLSDEEVEAKLQSIQKALK